MTNTYAINVTNGKEFEVEAELRRMGLTPWVARSLHSKYVKEKRAFSWYDKPYIPKLVFCVFPANYWTDVCAVKNVVGKPISLSTMDLRGIKACRIERPDGTFKDVPARHGLADFRDAVMAEYADQERAKANSEYECEYTAGQALNILSGAFTGRSAKFDKTIKNAHDHYAKLRVRVEAMGATVAVELDPDHVRAN